MEETCFWKEARLLLTNMLTLTVLFSMVVGVWSDIFVKANPIPIPAIFMPEEYINATISLVDRKLLARVDGAYPFENIGYSEVKMYYPVPPKSREVSVTMNETSLDWTFSNEIYSTVIGDWTMINWTISRVRARVGPKFNLLLYLRFHHVWSYLNENNSSYNERYTIFPPVWTVRHNIIPDNCKETY